MLKFLAYLLGFVLFVVGVAGFIPAAHMHGLFLGHFAVNWQHNLVHLVSGLVLLYGATKGANWARWSFRFLGIVYAAVAVYGLYTGEGMILGQIITNAADNWLHVGFAVLFLLIGFSSCRHDYKRTDE